MKKIIIALLFLVIAGGVAFVYLSQNTFISSVPLEQRTYLAPSMYVQLPSVTGDVTVRFGQDRLTLDRNDNTFESIKAPEWTVLESKDRYTNFTLGKLSIVPANEKFMYLEQESLGEYSGYSIFSQKTVINENVLTQEVVGEKTLDSRNDLKIKIEIPYKDEPNQKFRNVDEAKAFLNEIISGLSYSGELLGSAADRFAELESNIFSLFGGLDPDDIDEVKNWPPELMTSILFSELQQVPLDSAAQRTFKEEGTVSGFCDKLYEGANEASEIIPDSLSCVSTDKDILLLITLDSDADYCIDSRGFRGLVNSGSVGKNATMCQQ